MYNKGRRKDMPTYSPDKVKASIQMFLLMAQGIVAFLPGDRGQTIKDILKLASGLVAQNWFSELIAYLLNTFSTSKPTLEQLAEALRYFADKVQADGIAPAFMPTPAVE
jgi:hypothetical protein